MQQTVVCVKMLKCVSVLCLVISIFLTKDIDAQQIRGPATDFSRHSLAKTTIHHVRTRREISTTRDTAGTHHKEVILTVNVEGEDYVLELRLNDALLPKDHVIRYQKDGQMMLHQPSGEELDLCQYSGTIRGRPASWAAISTCHGVRGVMFDGKSMKYIEPGDQESNLNYVYDHSDLNQVFHCGYKGGVTNNTSYDPLLLKKHLSRRKRDLSRISRHKRDEEDTKVRGPFNSNKLSRYLELVLVVDHREYQANNEDMRTVHHQMKDIANIMNSVYTPLNIFIALVGVVVWTERDEIPLQENGDDTLNDFLAYRRKVLLREIPNDNAQLLTRQTFAEGIVGKALKGPICTFQYSGGIANNHSSVIGLVAMTIAHELGHNLGMEHDTEEDCVCPDEKCIMSPSSTSRLPIHWSSCSMKSLALAFERGMDYCLRNKPAQLFEPPTCGNGFVEPGEQCDCGSSVDAASRTACERCCHPDTCVLRNNATCATGQCCDLQTCRPKAAGTVCRDDAGRECDLPEYCTGHSEYCPADVHKMDTTPCGKGLDAYCVRGSCRSHTDQCRLLWGITGEMSHDDCYKSLNVKGDKTGNCGYDRIKQEFRACRTADAFCGMLQCRHLNEQLQFGMESTSLLAHTFINNNGTIAPCRTAIIDMGLGQTDPGLVPDGASCGREMMCMNQKCVSVASVRYAIAKKESSVCPSNCSGHGVCNSEGECHCDAGFAPPLCELPGPGGSYSSGPATDATAQRNFMVTMYIIFLGIIPSILLILFLIYYSKHNVLGWWKKPKKSMQSPKKTSLQRRISKSASKFASSFQNSNHSALSAPVAAHAHPPASPDDMSSSLLRPDAEPPGNHNPTVNFFGNFKGFSLTPMEKKAKEDAERAHDTIKRSTVETINTNKSAKITPVHRSSSQNLGALKPVLRSAPPLPVVPATTKSSPKTSPSIKRANSSVQNRIKALMSTEKAEDLPPASINPPPRPVISSPILEASTCTAKELISPLQGSKTLGPARVAPGLPTTSPDLPKRPLSMHSAGNVLLKPLPEEPKKVKEGISLNRIASFLKQDKAKEKERNPVERSHSLPKNPNHQIKVPKSVDKVALRNLQISNPILQKKIDLPVNTVSVVSDSEDADDPKAFVNRAQSMRGPSVTQKPVIQSFGSMRQAPGVPRPVSIVGRPTAPPPPAPNQTNSTPTSLYQNPKPLNEIKSTDYVDCIEEKQAPLAHIDEESSDNIYAIIEESPEKHSRPLPGVPPHVKTIPQAPPEGYQTPKPITSNSGSTESMGLLGEIVHEIQSLNFDSIYSASTMKNKKDIEKKTDEGNRDSTYMNTDHYKTPESVYSNSGAKSSVSTTSSGYLNPSAVNVPTYMNKAHTADDAKQKPSTEVAPSSPTMKVNSKIPTFSRQVTPPGLRTTSTFKNVPQSPKNTPKNGAAKQIIANSPDVVSSCAVAEIKNEKPPDIINNNKVCNDTPKAAAKPAITAKPNDSARPPIKTGPMVEKKPTVKTTASVKPVNSPTNLNHKADKTPPLNRVNSKVDSNVKAITDNLNKNKPKIVPKPSTISVQRTDSNVKPGATKLAARPSNVASLQQKFENRKSIGRDTATVKK